MRHLRGLAPVEVALVARGVISPAGRGPLVAAIRGAYGLASRKCRACPSAVPIVIVAPGTQEEDLAAASTGHEAQGLDVRVRPIV